MERNLSVSVEGGVVSVDPNDPDLPGSSGIVTLIWTGDTGVTIDSITFHPDAQNEQAPYSHRSGTAGDAVWKGDWDTANQGTWSYTVCATKGGTKTCIDPEVTNGPPTSRTK